jgi:hypothetical protein
VQRTAVESTNVASVGYDIESAVLEVEFAHGGIYHYFGVPLFVYQGLMNASSKGKYLNEVVKRGGDLYTRTG